MMPTSQTLALFAAAAVAVTLCPGPSMAYVASRSLGQGRTAGIVSALGLATGLLIHTIAASLGLSAVFAYSPWAYATIKGLGAVYLIYLGLRLFSAKESPLESTAAQPTTGLLRVYHQGLLTEILNPKTALFYLSFLPQFVEPAQGPPATQMFVLGMILLLTALSMDLFIAMAGGAVSGWLSQRRGARSVQRRLAGTVLIGLGIRLATSGRE